MQTFDPKILQKLFIPAPDSHKGQNGKLMIIGGSHLFHAASLWPLEIASKIVDMVFYSSVPENNAIVQKEKELFHNGIIVPRDRIEDYIEEADAVLIGPGMVRAQREISNFQFPISNNIHEIEKIPDEGLKTFYLTRYLLHKYPKKKWIIDAGALQMMHKDWLHSLEQAVITPHPIEFQRLFNLPAAPEDVSHMARRYNTIILMKGQTDVVCSPDTSVMVEGGNAGMTKGGTGDVLAGLVAALATKNDLLLAAQAGSYLNKKAGESLYKRVGLYFNASDLVAEIPVVMKKLLL